MMYVKRREGLLQTHLDSFDDCALYIPRGDDLLDLSFFRWGRSGRRRLGLIL